VSRFAVVDGRLVDVLETLGGWHTAQMLAAEYEARWVRVSIRSIQRSVLRLVEAGDVERRETEAWSRSGTAPVRVSSTK
jgi:predicted transcriptional regulator